MPTDHPPRYLALVPFLAQGIQTDRSRASCAIVGGQRRWFSGNLGQPGLLVNWIVDNLGDRAGSRAPQPDEA